MSITAAIYVDGELQTSSAIEVALYVDGVLVHTAFNNNYSVGGQFVEGIIGLMALGDQDGQTITFAMYNHETEEGDDYECSSTLSFEIDGMVGSTDAPFQLAFTSNQGGDDDDNPAYPWTIDQGDTGNNATGIFQVKLNGVLVEDQNTYDLGAFCGDECRAHRSNFLTTSGQPLWLLTFKAKEVGEEYHFLLYDINNGRYFRGTCDVVLTYSNNAVYGSGTNPLVLNFIAPYVFEGTESTSWSTENNWYEPAVGLPADTNEVTINGLCELDQDVTVNNLIINEEKTLKVMPGTTLNLTDGFVNNGELILVDDAQLIDAAQTEGDATYMKTVTGYSSNDDNWYLISSPVGNKAIASTDFPTGNYDLYWYDETNLTHEEWRNYKQDNSYSFIPGKGYLYANKVDCTPSIPGTLSYENVSINMTYTDRWYDDLEGLNLIGNPYPFAITLDNFKNDKLTNGFYLLENGAWSSQSASTTIPAGQAFLIGCTESNTVTFQANTSKGRSANRSTIKVNIANSTYADHAFIVLEEGNDLIKIDHRNTNIPAVYVPKSDKAYAVAHFSKGTENVPVAYRPTLFGQQTLSVELEGNYEYMTLTDNLTGTVVNLLTTPSYTFNSNENDLATRFTLRFKANTNVNEGEIINPISYRSNGELNINGLEGESTLQVIDMLGRTVSSSTINGTYSQKLNMNAGVYVIRVVNGLNTYTEKIVIE